MKTDIIGVLGMSCSHCENAVNKALLALNGVTEADASAEMRSVKVTFDENLVSLKEIREAIEDEGYDVAL